MYRTVPVPGSIPESGPLREVHRHPCVPVLGPPTPPVREFYLRFGSLEVGPGEVPVLPDPVREQLLFNHNFVMKSRHNHEYIQYPGFVYILPQI